MNQILTDEEIVVIAKQYDGNQKTVEFWFARSIESTILNKLNSAEPVAWQERQQTKIGFTNWYDSGKPPSRDKKLSEVIDGIEYQWRPLFIHPPAPSVPYGLHIIDCGFKRCGTEATPTLLIGFAENDWDARDKFKAMLSAKE